MKVLILGGGICGLSAAWFLKKQDPSCHITLLEKSNRLGGWIQTSHDGGFLFEKGPRTFRFGHCPRLLQLISELNLEIIHSAPSPRYLLHRGKLRSMSYFLPMLIPHLLREPFIKPGSEDESIYDFAARRFSPKIANTLFDPLTLGIYAGDIHKLSVRACFPKLVQWEKEHGSVLRGLFRSPKKPQGLFTIAGGVESLTSALQKQLQIEIVLNCPETDGKLWKADRIISALPPKGPKESLWVVNVGFDSPVLKKRGFGYLVPSQEGSNLLGVLFDSNIFPEQNRPGQTRLTAMLRASERAPLEAALQALASHLGISAPPTFTSVYKAQEAIPQYLTGTVPDSGVSVEARIEYAWQLVSS